MKEMNLSDKCEGIMDGVRDLRSEIHRLRDELHFKRIEISRLGPVIEPARALVEAVTAWRPEAFGPDAGCRVYTAKEAGHVSAVGNALRETRAALDAAEGEGKGSP